MKKNIIKQFHEFLDKNLYAELVTTDMLMNKISWESFLSFGPDIFKSINRNNELFKLFLFCESVSYENFIAKYSYQEWIDCFVNEKIMIKNGDMLSMNNFILVILEKKYILVDTPLNFKTCKDKNTKVYLGVDSLILLINQSFEKVDKVLDICTGSGIQLLTSDNFYSKAIGVDISEDALNVAEFNSILNNLENKILFKKSNIYENIFSTFDLIYANPPFLPMDKKLEFSSIGDGGEDGFKILDRIISGFPKYLNKNGKAIIIGECLGDCENPMIIDFIKSKLTKGYICNIIINACIPSKIVAKRLAYVKAYQINDISKLNEYSQYLYDLYKSYGDYYFQYILKIQKLTSSKKSVIKSIFNCSQILLTDKYSFIDEYNLNKEKRYISFGNNILIKLNNNLVNLLSQFDGKTTLCDCLKNVSLTYEFEEIYLQLVPVIQELINNNILCRNVTY